MAATATTALRTGTPENLAKKELLLSPDSALSSVTSVIAAAAGAAPPPPPLPPTRTPPLLHPPSPPTPLWSSGGCFRPLRVPTKHNLLTAFLCCLLALLSCCLPNHSARTLSSCFCLLSDYSAPQNYLQSSRLCVLFTQFCTTCGRRIPSSALQQIDALVVP